MPGKKGSSLKESKEVIKKHFMEYSTNYNPVGLRPEQQAFKEHISWGKKYFISEGNNRVILATDGDFNVGVSSEGELVRLIEEKRKTGIYLSILGYGMGNYQESKMQELSKAGNGNHFYIDNIEEAKKSLMHEFGSTMHSIANDVKIQIEFNPNFVKSYRVVGYENRQLANADFNDDTKDAGELGAGHIVTVIYEIVPKESKSNVAGSIDPLKYSQNTLSGIQS
jgi:Ca-activated chloride channel family protein